MVDDSIVRGNTIRAVLGRLTSAAEIHIRITSPPVCNECHYGIDIPDTKKLFVVGKTEEEMAVELGVTSIRYLSTEDLEGPVCKACFEW